MFASIFLVFSLCFYAYVCLKISTFVQDTLHFDPHFMTVPAELGRRTDISLFLTIWKAQEVLYIFVCSNLQVCFPPFHFSPVAGIHVRHGGKPQLHELVKDPTEGKVATIPCGNMTECLENWIRISTLPFLLLEEYFHLPRRRPLV